MYITNTKNNLHATGDGRRATENGMYGTGKWQNWDTAKRWRLRTKGDGRRATDDGRRQIWNSILDRYQSTF